MKNKSLLVLITAIITLSIAGCATTHQARSVKPSGFLANSEQLKKGNRKQALLRYVNPSAPWTRYTKVILLPVRLYAGQGSDLHNANPEQRLALANYFTAALHQELGKNYRIVTTPGPDVMIIRTAITDADESEVLLDTVTTIMPIGLAASTLKRVAVGSDSFVGDAQAEMEILDSLSGIRIAAAVDKRIGTKALRTKFGAWNHAKAAFDYWAEQLRERLEEVSSKRF